MAKQIYFPELAQIVSTLLVRPDLLGELDDASLHERFAASIAEVVADYCGGLVNGVNGCDVPCSPLDEEGRVSEMGSTVSIDPSDSLPSLNRNVWSLYDCQGWEGYEMDVEDGQPYAGVEEQEIIQHMQKALRQIACHNPAAPVPEIESDQGPGNYTVELVRTAYSKKTLSVTGAESQRAAERAALDMAGDHIFSEFDADYDVESSAKTA
ncbi:hypothetical protein [Marinobacter sp. P4B1]|uniref:hypothetical protein n=1 Tax=Marinobacter sp. P4B1 TaxID=1119533 RepID=UPI00071E5ABF|nr:hypothetical protein [Marinobacter sp. P4B1]KRW83676.1 hypothetical protein AQ621_16640 [Marinobacter sp. P4B1]